MGPRPNRQGFSSEVCFGQPEAVLKHACLQGGNGHWLWLAARQSTACGQAHPPRPEGRKKGRLHAQGVWPISLLLARSSFPF